MPSIIVAPEQLPPWTLRTEIPTVVADLCEDACDLAVWRAIRWLISLSGRDRLGVDARTIAAHAKVDVKTALRCINGDRTQSKAKRRPRNLKRGLVGLGLLEVVGSQPVGKLKPRPVYRIPRWIEEQNAHHTRALLARLGMEPPAPAPPPGQTELLLELDPKTEQRAGPPGVLESPAGVLDPISAQRERAPAEEVLPASALDPYTAQLHARCPSLLDPYVDQPDTPVPFSDQAGGSLSQQQQNADGQLFAALALDPDTEQAAAFGAARTDPNLACWKEGGKEGGRERVAPPLQFGSAPPPRTSAASSPTPATVKGRQEQSREEGYAPPSPPQSLGSAPPPTSPPEGLFVVHPGWSGGSLPAHPRDLWRRACTARRPIDDDQLAILASEHDATTGGHGWYWVGRAILAAAVAEDIHSIAKVRRTLERWRAEDTYGSDAPVSRRPPSPVAPGPRHARAAEPRGGRVPLSERLGLTDVFQEV